MWYPEAIKREGPTWKIQAGTNTVSGVVMHSAEGWTGGNWFEITRPGRQSGWHFFNRTDGVLEQHYSLDSIVTNAGAWANANLIAIENEGVAGTQLTEEQIESSRKFIYWLGEQRGWKPERGKTMFQHNDAGVMGAATACPSNRIPWDRY